MKKGILLFLLILLSACSTASVAATLPDDKFLIIAHRGASAYAPEHSLLSYGLAVQMKADYIELDVHMTKDGELVSMHDPFVHLPNGRKTVAEVDFQELKSVRRESDYDGKLTVSFPESIDPLRIVSTEEIFSYFQDDVNYYIELKTPASYPGIEEALLGQLREFGLLPLGEAEMPKVILQSFNANSLLKIHEQEPTIPLIQLYSLKNETMLTKKRLQKVAAYASGIGVDKTVVTEELVELVHGEGLHIHPFTVNEEKEIRRMIEIGADGIFTDVPDVAIKVLKDLRGE
ncbi:glycerophosphodiester phosphodiesterase family protein [Sporosarcina sp. Marseille-Q4943]|uniref:glycerophosphodiester phosphodiesterase family protein n=1 Tax=Sporosarcina sp. Marseille-Q4943 TaxID=2942204 RepID=UPI00208DB7E3|nr:glycerophosphodiester phosphodiesterase family protein [Sporosarcina sp. Marseille-Q4943]